VRDKLPILVGLALATALPAVAESTRTLQGTIAIGREVAVENLAGMMKVVPGKGSAIEVVATVHAESEALAQSIRLEEVSGEKGVPTLRVRYPLDQESRLRYPDGPGGSATSGFWPFGGHSRTRYDGRRVSVSSDSGTLLYVDLEVRVPKGAHATFKSHLGPVTGDGVEGTLRFDTGSGPIRVRAVRGDVVADTGSGDVEARELAGLFRCDTGSGDCDVEGFEGERLTCDTGSGDVDVRAAKAERIDADTGSGRVRLSEVDAEELRADTGSGRIEIEATSLRLRRVEADTGSGDVRLRIPAEIGFLARADLGSGHVRCDIAGAQTILDDRRVVGCRSGDEALRIRVDTGSGDLEIASR
jgi:hypothetical protein